MVDGLTSPEASIPNSERKTLGDFETTSPSEHDPNNFRYIVHCFVPDNLKGVFTKVGSKRAADKGWHPENQSDPIEDTEQFLKREYISCSVVDQDHLATWSNAGIILNAERKNLMLTFGGDAGIVSSTDADREQFPYPVMPFSELLDETSPFLHNEIVVRGSEGYPPLSIAGVFIKTDPQGQYIHDMDAEVIPKARNLAARLNVPVVEMRGMPTLHTIIPISQPPNASVEQPIESSRGMFNKVKVGVSSIKRRFKV